MSKKVKCPFCFHNVLPVPSANGGQKCGNPECESHKQEIPFPPEVFTHELFPIAIVGPSSSGKTFFLTAVMNEFMQRPPWSGDGGYWDLDVVHYAADIRNEGATNKFIGHWKTLFKEKRRLDPTVALENVWLPPLLLSIAHSRNLKWTMKEPLRKRKLLLAFHDVPGEFTTDDNARMALAKRYGALNEAKGIIVLVEPTELPRVKSTLVNARMIPEGGETDTRESSLEAIKGLRLARQRKKPVAICLSKSDLLLSTPSLFPRESHLAQYEQTDFRKEGVLQLGDVRETTAQVRDTFEQFNAGDYLPLMSQSFRYYAFFAISAMGREVINPFTDEIVATPQPIRVLDPILWILWQWGLLGGE